MGLSDEISCRALAKGGSLSGKALLPTAMPKVRLLVISQRESYLRSSNKDARGAQPPPSPEKLTERIKILGSGARVYSACRSKGVGHSWIVQ